MPNMSIYRSREPVKQYAQADTLSACSGKNDVQLVKLAIKTGRPALVALDGVASIVKTAEEGDQASSFEALFDTCYTTLDLRKMRQAGVDDPAEVPLVAFRVDMEFPIACKIAMTVAIPAADNADARHRLRELAAHDIMFRYSLQQEILNTLASALERSEELPMHVLSTTSAADEPLDPPLDPNGPQWRILAED